MNPSQNFDLLAMKDYFEKEMDHIRLISDISLSEAEFKMLGIKLKEVFKLPNYNEIMDNLMICYLVYWVYALIYWDEEVGIHDELTDFCSNLPQYQVRHHLSMLVDTLDDYNVNDFGYDRSQIDDFCSMVISRHAGIPFNEQSCIFDWIDDYRRQDCSIEKMLEALYLELPYKSYYIFSLLDQGSRQQMIWEIRTIMAEVSARIHNKSELLIKYPKISSRLIDSCLRWYEDCN